MRADLFSLSGKVALVTGGGQGIGKMAAAALLDAGARVIIASRKEDQIAAASKELSSRGDCTGLRGDVGSEQGVRELASAFSAVSSRLDILVNNAGITWGAPLESFPFDAWSRVTNVNLAGPFTLVRELLPMLQASATPSMPSRIINVSSVFGILPVAESAYSYAASKAALNHLTRILAAELAPRNITVNCIAPGPFLTKMTAFSLGDQSSRNAAIAAIPLGRIGEDDDMAGALIFLTSKAGRYVTGAIVPLDGGLTATGPHAILGGKNT